MRNKKPSPKFWIVVLGVFTLLATIQIAFLTIQNRRLKNTINSLGAGQQPDGLKPGDQLQAFSTVDGEGKETRVSYESGDHLLLITSTKCQWCAKTMPSWKEVADKAKLKGIHVIAISIDGKDQLKKYSEDNAVNFEVVTFPSDEVLLSYKATSTPQTILVKRGGRVEKVWQGSLSPEAKDEIVKLIM